MATHVLDQFKQCFEEIISWDNHVFASGRRNRKDDSLEFSRHDWDLARAKRKTLVKRLDEIRRQCVRAAGDLAKPDVLQFSALVQKALERIVYKVTHDLVLFRGNSGSDSRVSIWPPEEWKELGLPLVEPLSGYYFATHRVRLLLRDSSLETLDICLKESATIQQEPRREQRGKRITIDQRMKLVLFEKPESSGWSITEFAIELKCSRGGIHKTASWTSLEALRKLGKVERRKDRRARTRRS